MKINKTAKWSKLRHELAQDVEQVLETIPDFELPIAETFLPKHVTLPSRDVRLSVPSDVSTCLVLSAYARKE